MKYKSVPISRAIEILVPLGLTPEQEAAYVADYVAKHDPEGELRKIIAEVAPAELEAECANAMEAYERGEKSCCSIEEILLELEADQKSADGDAA
jgi:hypothetical protein